MKIWELESSQPRIKAVSLKVLERIWVWFDFKLYRQMLVTRLLTMRIGERSFELRCGYFSEISSSEGLAEKASQLPSGENAGWVAL